MPELELIATATFGLEAVVARELKQLGFEQQRVENGRVYFTADETAICKANLWLRSADRVLLRIAEFEARDFGSLFDQTTECPWEEWLTIDAEFPVRGKSVRSQLHSVPHCQSIVKKAIVERMKKAHNRDWFDETGPKFAVEVSVLNDIVTLTVDTTGPGLHKRGYRTLSGESPLKETLAAGMIQLSYWKPDRPLVDPFCGTGTIPIEAALIARNIAPGLARTFSAEAWPRIPKALWKQARTEAKDLQVHSAELSLIGTDIDNEVLSLARFHARAAGVEAEIHFQQQPFHDLSSRRKFGCAICNPPYGHRSGDQSEVEKLYTEMSTVFGRLDSWSIYVLTPHLEFEKLLGRKADRRRKLYNGRIACTYYQFHGPRPPWKQPSRENHTKAPVESPLAKKSNESGS